MKSQSTGKVKKAVVFIIVLLLLASMVLPFLPIFNQV